MFGNRRVSVLNKDSGQIYLSVDVIVVIHQFWGGVGGVDQDTRGPVEVWETGCGDENCFPAFRFLPAVSLPLPVPCLTLVCSDVAAPRTHELACSSKKDCTNMELADRQEIFSLLRLMNGGGERNGAVSQRWREELEQGEIVVVLAWNTNCTCDDFLWLPLMCQDSGHFLSPEFTVISQQLRCQESKAGFNS